MNTSRIFILIAAAAVLVACGQPAPNDQAAAPGESTQSSARKIIYYRDPMNPAITSPVPKKGSMGMDYTPVYAASAKSEQSGERKILYYRNPMNPAATSPVPMKDSMGMAYVPVYAGEGGETAGSTVRISPAVEENLGILTAPVVREDLHRLIHTVGYVSYDQSAVLRLHTRAAGWITELPITSTGELVRKGQLLFRLYSPTLVTAEQEYLQAMKGGNAMFIEAASRRLHALGIADDEIARLKQTHEASKSIAYYAERTGVVEMLNARPGLYVTPDTEVMRLGVLSNVWLVAEVYENQAGWVRVGDQAEARLASAPGEVLKGTVNFIYPELNPVTRTLKVRMTFANPDVTLLPNMYADVTIAGAPAKNVLTVPTEALIRTGNANNRVILALGNGRFRAQPVTPGIESGGRVAILSGLKEGETVVTSGQFLIDSEASLNASLQRLSVGNGNNSGGGQ
ncbi:MAG: efflux RND transporter periplasmic adaptor subunit [Gammaproteobacteria bacterium]|nr:efflux RND transporter periplasmic adaptor subunit [Gammaproteobacteria bacterium]MDE2274241.1 efflux RND transporter periplasmic adaptor subunit [Gammaproteobacteria bacterium]